MERYEPMLEQLNKITHKTDTKEEYRVTIIGRTYRLWQQAVPKMHITDSDIKVIYEFPNQFSLIQCLNNAIVRYEPAEYLNGFRQSYKRDQRLKLESAKQEENQIKTTKP